MSDQNRHKWLVLFGLAALLVAVYFTFNFLLPDDDHVLKSGRRDFDRGRYPAARAKFLTVVHRSRLSSGVRCEAAIFAATTLLRENRLPEAAEEFRRFIKEYPNSFWTPQAYFDLAYTERQLGDRGAAVGLYRKIIAEFPTTSWAQYSRDRLKELGEFKQ